MIEHLEPCVNRWLLKEYEYVSMIYGSRLIITNVKKSEHKKILSKYAKVKTESIVEISRNDKKIIVLDPKSNKPLEPGDLEDVNYVVIGGIMGSYPPKGRTWFYITSKLSNAYARNIGIHQYTIAGAAYVLRNIELGKKVSDIRYVYGLTYTKEMSNGIVLEIFLPYAFPLDDDGNLVLPDSYLKIVTEHIIIQEYKLLGSSENSIC